jgi:hypothetical protein
MTENEREWMDRIRHKVHTLLASRTPEEARALRTRFGIGAADPPGADEEGTLRALARELAMLKRKKPG